MIGIVTAAPRGTRVHAVRAHGGRHRPRSLFESLGPRWRADGAEFGSKTINFCTFRTTTGGERAQATCPGMMAFVAKQDLRAARIRPQRRHRLVTAADWHPLHDYAGTDPYQARRVNAASARPPNAPRWPSFHQRKGVRTR